MVSRYLGLAGRYVLLPVAVGAMAMGAALGLQKRDFQSTGKFTVVLMLNQVLSAIPLPASDPIKDLLTELPGKASITRALELLRQREPQVAAMTEEEFCSRLSVEAKGNVVEVSYRDRDARIAEAAVNAVMDRWREQRASRGTDPRLEKLRREVARLKMAKETLQTGNAAQVTVADQASADQRMHDAEKIDRDLAIFNDRILKLEDNSHPQVTAGPVGTAVLRPRRIGMVEIVAGICGVCAGLGAGTLMGKRRK